MYICRHNSRIPNFRWRYDFYLIIMHAWFVAVSLVAHQHRVVNWEKRFSSYSCRGQIPRRADTASICLKEIHVRRWSGPVRILAMTRIVWMDFKQPVALLHVYTTKDKTNKFSSWCLNENKKREWRIRINLFEVSTRVVQTDSDDIFSEARVLADDSELHILYSASWLWYADVAWFRICLGILFKWG